jgi:hypothetical protein
VEGELVDVGLVTLAEEPRELGPKELYALQDDVFDLFDALRVVKASHT